MSYEPTNWRDGDVVTSAKLNKIEQGIAAGGGVLIVHINEQGVLDKTWQEIYDAVPNVVLCEESPLSEQAFKNVAYLTLLRRTSENRYDIYWFAGEPSDNSYIFINTATQSPDDYPTFQEQVQG